MKTFFITFLFQIAIMICVLIWVTGALILTYQFFREFRGKKYSDNSEESSLFTKWKTDRALAMKKGLLIFIAGITFHFFLFLFKL